jgi:uncharacterized protein YecE (DUF72 family)
MRVIAGTSGYAYREWKGPFYPKKIAASRMLAWYAATFGIVEINSSFYELPAAETIARWAAEVPPGFRFAFKAPGRITHQKRLAGAASITAQLFERVGTLGDRLGPVLFGLPPNMKKDRGRLAAFIAGLPADRRVSFELRHASWLSDDVYELLRGRDIALCIADGEKVDTPFVATASWGYLRLRRPRYGPRALAAWAEKIAAAPWSDAVVFFKHEDRGRAPKLAAELMSLVAPPPPPAAS